MQQIAKSEDIEFLKLCVETNDVLNNMFVFTANELGVSRMEKMLHIKNEKKWDLETRKLNIAAKMNDSKMSISDLKNLISEYEQEIQFINNNQTQEIIIVSCGLTEGKLKTINNIIENVLPLNISYKMELNDTTSSNIYIGMHNRASPQIVCCDNGLFSIEEKTFLSTYCLMNKNIILC